MGGRQSSPEAGEKGVDHVGIVAIVTAAELESRIAAATVTLTACTESTAAWGAMTAEIRKGVLIDVNDPKAVLAALRDAAPNAAVIEAIFTVLNEYPEIDEHRRVCEGEDGERKGLPADVQTTILESALDAIGVLVANVRSLALPTLKLLLPTCSSRLRVLLQPQP
jgi:hypothetical protein